jgi:phosphatidylglycerophosphate synthase
MAERRPIATRKAPWAKSLARAVSRAAISANAVSVTGVGFAAGAGAALLLSRGPHWRPWLVVAAAGIQLRLLCNMIDGMVALEHGRATPTGALYNDVPDRLADTVILVAAGYAAGQAELGWASAIAAMLTAYVRVLGGALGTPQFFLGPQSKSQRMAVVSAAALLSALLPSSAWAARLITLALLVVLLGSIATTIRRLRLIARELLGRGA